MELIEERFLFFLEISELLELDFVLPLSFLIGRLDSSDLFSTNF